MDGKCELIFIEKRSRPTCNYVDRPALHTACFTGSNCLRMLRPNIHSTNNQTNHDQTWPRTEYKSMLIAILQMRVIYY